MLKIKNLSLILGKKDILKDISINIPKGKISTIIGQNGAGKTSFLKCLAGIYTYQGIIKYNEEKITNFPSIKLAQTVSYIPQIIDSNMNLNLYDFLALSRFPWQQQIKLTSYEKELIEKVIKLTELKSHLQKPFSILSGGEKQLAMLAAALVQETDILLVDEVTSMLDPYYQIKINSLLEDICKSQKKTIIRTCHNLNTALNSSDYILAIKDGKLYNHGNTKTFHNEDKLADIFHCKFKIENLNGKIIVLNFC